MAMSTSLGGKPRSRSLTTPPTSLKPYPCERNSDSSRNRSGVSRARKCLVSSLPEAIEGRLCANLTAAARAEDRSLCSGRKTAKIMAYLIVSKTTNENCFICFCSLI